MVGWHHRLDGHELELGQTLGDGEGQGSLACCSPWCHKELEMTATEQQQELGWRDNEPPEIQRFGEGFGP